MKRYFTFASYLFFLGLVSLVSPLPAIAATVNLATSPLTTSTSTSVKPNILFVLDDSGSMAWDHMPDDDNDNGSSVTWQFGYYGLRSSQCNQVYYDPNATYTPPVTDAVPAVSYPNATFTSAWTDGFNTGSGTVNLNTSFQAAQSFTGVSAVDPFGQSAYYYLYSGGQTSQSAKDYNSTTNTFYTECHVGRTAANTLATTPPGGTTVFSKRRLATTETTTIVVGGGGSGSGTSVASIVVGSTIITSGPTAQTNNINTLAGFIAAKISLSGYSATSSGNTVTITGPTSAKDLTPAVIPLLVAGTAITFTTDIFPDTTAANLTNFANWYSYYRTRILMMKTAAGQAFSTLDTNYRVGLLQLSSSNAPAVELNTFTGTQRTNWYNTFYGITPGGSTPLRVALSDAGRYYAGLMGGSITDPMQYSCQQNFSIMSTDGYWNGTSAGYGLDGSTAVGNQDDLLARPYYDGATALSTYTYTYTRDFYSKTTSGCGGGNKKLKTQPQIGTCTLASSTGSCTPGSWSSNGAATVSGSCNSTAAPSPTTPFFIDISQNTSGGSSDSLADIASYYYQTDLRTPTLGNCTGAISGELLCSTPVAPATEDPYNNVFDSGTDKNKKQHMTTFTLGLGASGKMNYTGGYAKDGTNADYDAVRLGLSASSTVCKWQTAGTTCNWPLPGLNGSDGKIENIDDLWHAAVNGHGTYFSATNPDTLSSGIVNALAGINSRKGAAAAAATSTLSPVPGNNFAFFASYTTVEWKGNLEARGVNTDTGEISSNATWCVESIQDPGTCSTTPVAQNTGDTTIYNCETPSPGFCPDGGAGEFSGDSTSGPLVCKVPVATACTGTMNAKVSTTTDTRTIKTANSTGNALINFDATYATANSSYFNAAHINTLSQWPSLDIAQQGRAANGTNLINYLRGQSGFENRTTNVTGSGSTLVDNQLFRARSAVLGDALESQPAFIGKPIFSYPYPGYSAFKTAQASRAGAVYMGANDGMMHAFASATGVESWAYVPSMVIPNMWKLADFNYGTSHSNFVNGSPIVSDVCISGITACASASTAVWKTILVAGIGGGGRGYFALDITDPTTPILLWEFTNTTGIGLHPDDDLGYSYGQPVITKKLDGRWVVLVTSGYNNVSPGDGKGYLYVLDAATGVIISKISTGVGNTTTPSGLAKIAGWNEEPPGNSVQYVYGGDLLGNVWRFDLNGTTTASIGTGDVLKFATLFSDSTTAGAAGSNPQPIMTTPVLGKISGSRIVYISTGKYLETGDLTTTQKQTQYAIKDSNSSTFVNPRSYNGGLMVQQTMTVSTGGNSRSSTPAVPAPNFNTGRGWFVDFPESGERANIDSKLVQGVLLTPTIVPSNTACSPGGHAWFNLFDYKTGSSVPGSIISSRYDEPIVGFNVFYIDSNGDPTIDIIGAGGKITTCTTCTFPPKAGNFVGKRTLWRELIQ